MSRLIPVFRICAPQTRIIRDCGAARSPRRSSTESRGTREHVSPVMRGVRRTWSCAICLRVNRAGLVVLESGDGRIGPVRGTCGRGTKCPVWPRARVSRCLAPPFRRFYIDITVSCRLPRPLALRARVDKSAKHPVRPLQTPQRTCSLSLSFAATHRSSGCARDGSRVLPAPFGAASLPLVLGALRGHLRPRADSR